MILKGEVASLRQRSEMSINELTKAMSQVSIKDVEIKQLKEKNNQVQQQNKILQEKVSKHKINLRGQLPLQGEKHLLWDVIAIEIIKFLEYVYFIEENDALASATLLKCEIVNEAL